METTGVRSESGLMGCSPNDSPRLTPNTWSWSTWGRIGEQSHRALSREDGGGGPWGPFLATIPLQKLRSLPSGSQYRNSHFSVDFGKKQTHF